MRPYFLTPQVYLCVADDEVVLFDLARDKYFELSSEQTAFLAPLVEGWPTITSRNDDDAFHDKPRLDTDAMLASMLASNLLTADASIGKQALPMKMPDASSVLVEPQLRGRPVIRFLDVIRFLRASTLMALTLRALPIRSVMRNVSQRKLVAVRRRLPFDADVARRATAAFIWLRPLLFGSQDRCLYDSLSLALFLSYYDQYPSCVIGVKSAPFGAHAWVQEGNAILNDEPEYVRRFTPIFAV